MHKEALAYRRHVAYIEELGGIPGLQVRHARSKETEFDAAMLNCMQALYWIAKEDIAFRKCESISSSSWC